MKYQLTLDGGLMRQSDLLPAVKTLREWEKEGIVEIFETDRAKETPGVQSGWPGGTRSAGDVRRRASRYRPAKGPATGPTFAKLSAVLFPSRDPLRLNMPEINSVAHLLRHAMQGYTAFVTTNVRDFIADGKRERLKTGYSILVLTPDEAVAMVNEALAAN